MTAGSGIIHQEMPKASVRMMGCQLWVNMPAKDKMSNPAYGDITKDLVAVVMDENDKLTFDEVKVRSGNQEARFVLLAGEPLKEPVAWGGPIVMNTNDEIDLAFEELDKGTFIKFVVNK